MGSPGAAAAVFTHANSTLQHQIGQARVLGTSEEGRYDRYSVEYMEASQLVFQIKAATTFCPQHGASSLILFSQPSPAYQTASFWGNFIQLTNFWDGGEFDFNLPSEVQSVASMLLVHTQKAPELKVSFRDQFMPHWNQFFSSHMPKQVKKIGNPSLTWDPFPKNEGSLSPNSIYLTVSQNLKVSFSDYWADYACQISYWLHLFVKDGKLSANVAQWWYYIEAGALTAVVKAILEPSIKLGAIELDKALKDDLAQFAVKDVYYLPGRQVDWEISPRDWNVFEGSTLDDVTIVLS